MRNHDTISVLDGISSRPKPDVGTTQTELSEEVLDQVVGGINPQPLPPVRPEFI